MFYVFAIISCYLVTGNLRRFVILKYSMFPLQEYESEEPIY
jgi:hypothetical protein